MTTNTDFLRFSAYSIKDLITQKLSQDSNFTDQIYEGSNLAILIDIFSYMAQCMMYALNNAASESMFADTQIYENINRLVNFIGYNPKGYQTASTIFTFNNSNNIINIIPRYSSIDINKTDSNGKKIYFSTIQDEQITGISKPQILFYNGIWKQYSTTFVSNGTAYQKFILDGLKSDTSDSTGKHIPQNMIHVYVYNKETNEYIQYKAVNEGLFTDNNIANGTYIYSNSNADQVFNIRLNETKTYEIQFGNGHSGKIPPKNSLIYILYLDGNGLDPNISLIPKEITDAKIKITEFSNSILKNIFSSFENDIENIKSILFENLTKTSDAIAEESVDDIRRNAPNWFKTGNRLVTAQDYIFYVKNRFADNIIDVVCQNNWQYISTFYKWLYELGLNGNYVNIKKREKNQNYYINHNKMMKYDYRYADASDSNNVYLWIKMRNESDVYKLIIEREVQNIKMLTQEIVQLNPINVQFTPCAAPIDNAIQFFNTANSSFNDLNTSYIELTLDDNIIYTDSDIISKATQIISDFFKEDSFVIGQFVDFSILSQRLYNQLTISNIRTVYNSKNTDDLITVNGLSFASWSSDLIDCGDDLIISTSGRSLETFQFPKLYDSNNLINKIKVIRKSVNIINTIQY